MGIFHKDPAMFSLILANLLAIVAAVWFNVSLFIILLTYWTQSMIIGFFNFIKILGLKEYTTGASATGASFLKPGPGLKTLIAFFFAFHYGFFHLVYLAGLLMIFLFSNIMQGAFAVASAETFAIDLLFVPLVGVVFFISHLFSFLYYRNRIPKKKPNIMVMMLFPYARVIPMHAAIMLAGFSLVGNSGQGFALVIFLLLKTMADVVMHAVEHRQQWV